MSENTTFKNGEDLYHELRQTYEDALRFNMQTLKRVLPGARPLNDLELAMLLIIRDLEHELLKDRISDWQERLERGDHGE